MDTSISKIQKLNENNYYTWNFKTQMLLIKEDLWDIIENNQSEIQDQSIEIQRECRKRDQKARAIISLLVEDSQLVYIRDKETAIETWTALKAIHIQDTLTNKISLYKKIALHRMEEGGDMQRHINTLVELFQKLLNLGANANDEWKIGMLFASLPSSYSTLVTALKARNQADLTWGLVTSKLLDERRRQKIQIEQKYPHEQLQSVQDE